MKECFGTLLKAKDRPIQLTYMKLRQSIGQSMLSDCKQYFAHHARLTSCFEDLRPFVEWFHLDETNEFLDFIRSHVDQQHTTFVANEVSSPMIKGVVATDLTLI